MTRKKWNRLRRRRPELFSRLPAWENMTRTERHLLKPVSKQRAITVMTTWFINSNPGESVYSIISLLFNPAHQETPRPVEVPGLAGQLWAPDPGFPPQCWPGVEVTQDRFLVDGKFHVEQSPAMPPK